LSPATHSWLQAVRWAHSPVIIGRHVLHYPSWHLPQAAFSLKKCRRWSVINVRPPWPHQIMCLPSHHVVLPQKHTVRGGVSSAVSEGRYCGRGTFSSKWRETLRWCTFSHQWRETVRWYTFSSNVVGEHSAVSGGRHRVGIHLAVIRGRQCGRGMFNSKWEESQRWCIFSSKWGETVRWCTFSKWGGGDSELMYVQQ
jgi:hypothetical protein